MASKPEKENFLAHWLNGDISEEEKKEFENSNGGAAYRDILNAMEFMKKPSFDARENFERQKEFNASYTQKKSKVIPLSAWIGSVAAAVILLVSLKMFVLDITTVRTGIGETKVVMLPDHSEVQLNAVSTLRYNPSKFLDNKKLTLKGQAFFKVAKGQKFVVHTQGAGKVQVLGTQFDVISRNKNLNVRCYEGKVWVTKKKQSEILTQGKGVTINAENELVRFYVPLEQPNWLNGEISYTAELLENVISELQRQYDISINTDKVNLERHFTGTFPMDNLEVALKAVFEPMNISYTFANQTEVDLEER